MTINIVVTGVGGQGVVSATDVISLFALKAGYDVKKSDVHGMAQRGGAVISFVRYGERIYSPIVEQNTADYIIALEELEAIREINFLKSNGIIIVSNFHTPPPEVALGFKEYPINIVESIKGIKPNVRAYFADAISMLKKYPMYSVNMYMLGIYACLQSYEKTLWMDAIKERFKNPDNAIKSFLYGYENTKKELL